MRAKGFLRSLAPRLTRPPLPQWFVLDSSVHMGAPPLGFDQEWAEIQCATRTAYGCGDHGQELLDGLRLYARVIRPNCITSALHIQANLEVVGAIRALFHAALQRFEYPIPIDSSELHTHGVVETTDKNYMVLVLIFDLEGLHFLSYYVVYDATDRSLTMVPCPPEPCLTPAGCTAMPLTVRHGVGGGYGLIVMLKKMVPPPPEGGDHTFRDVLYVWPPSAARSNSSAAACHDEEDHPWLVQGWHFPQQVQRPFLPEVMFSFQGKAFFADLTQGLVCCNLPTTTNAGGSGPILFDFIPLPADPGVPSALRWQLNRLEDTGLLDRDRTICCVQGSVRFACIDRSAAGPGREGDVKVSIWTLDLRSKKWVKDREFRAQELWRLTAFKQAKLPRTAPKCPVLMPDGTLCLLIPRLCMREQDPDEDYICNIDVKSMFICWSAPMDKCSYTAPVILPWDFFTAVIPPVRSTVRRGIFL